MTSQFADMTPLSNFYVIAMFFFIKFSNRSESHVNIVTIFFFKGLTRQLDIPLSNLLNVANCRGYSFYRFWVIKGKPTVNHPTPPHADLG